MTYAINPNGDVVSIDHVANGLDCNCICIECSGQLKAKQGSKNRWHFSHHKDNEATNCQWSGESEIHMKVKEYLERHKKLTVPIGFSKPTSLDIQFDEIQLEKAYGQQNAFLT
jgi:competence CoiA-like predicted nuclease